MDKGANKEDNSPQQDNDADFFNEVSKKYYAEFWDVFQIF